MFTWKYSESSVCICRAEFVVVGGNQMGAFIVCCAAIKLCSSSPQFSGQKLRVQSRNLTFPFSITNLTTNCSLYWNERVTFYTQGTVLEWDCHVLVSPPYILSLCNFSDDHACHIETGLRLRNPDIPYSIFISDQTLLFRIRVVPLHGPVFCILYIL